MVDTIDETISRLRQRQISMICVETESMERSQGGLTSRTVQRLRERIVRKRLQQGRVGLVPLRFNSQVHFFFGDGTRALVQRNLFDIGRHQVTLVSAVLVIALFNTKG